MTLLAHLDHNLLRIFLYAEASLVGTMAGSETSQWWQHNYEIPYLPPWPCLCESRPVQAGLQWVPSAPP